LTVRNRQTDIASSGWRALGGGVAAKAAWERPIQWGVMSLFLMFVAFVGVLVPPLLIAPLWWGPIYLVLRRMLSDGRQPFVPVYAVVSAQAVWLADVIFFLSRGNQVFIEVGPFLALVVFAVVMLARRQDRWGVLGVAALEVILAARAGLMLVRSEFASIPWRNGAMDLLMCVIAGVLLAMRFRDLRPIPPDAAAVFD
jgi:hypothetical protein